MEVMNIQKQIFFKIEFKIEKENFIQPFIKIYGETIKIWTFYFSRNAKESLYFTIIK